MAITNLSTELIREKHELIAKLETTTDSAKKIKIQERIGQLEGQIYTNAMNVLKKTKAETPKQFYEPKKEFTARELRKIVNDKRAVYSELAKQTRTFYSELVAKKREGEQIKELISAKNNKALKMALEY